MLRLLGRNTSGNVQKVLFALEELGIPYNREDYGRQFTAAIRAVVSPLRVVAYHVPRHR